MENPYCKICDLDKCLGDLCPLLNQKPNGKGATTPDDVMQEKLTVNAIRNSTP